MVLETFSNRKIWNKSRIFFNNKYVHRKYLTTISYQKKFLNKLMIILIVNMCIKNIYKQLFIKRKILRILIR